MNKKTLQILLFFLFLLLVTGLFYFLLFRGDDTPFDDSHLVLEEVEVVEEGNLYTFFEEEGLIGHLHSDKPTEEGLCGSVEAVDPASFMIRFSEGGAREHQTYYQFIEEYPERSRELVEINKEAYRCFDEMSEKTHYTHSGKIDMWDPESIRVPGQLLEMARANSFKSSYLLHQDRQEEAFERITKIMKVGTLITEAPRPYMLESFVGIGIHQIGLEAYYRYPRKVNISLESASSHAKRIADLELSEEDFARTFNVEYMITANIIDELEDKIHDGVDELPFWSLRGLSFFWNPEKTKKKLADAYSPMINLEEEKFSQLEDVREEIGDPTRSPLLSGLLQDNVVGRVLLSETLISIYPASQLKAIREANFKNRATGISLILQSHEREKGELPDNLEQLVPEYLSEVPKDPFLKEKSIIYSPEERTLYSEKVYEAEEGGKTRYRVNF